MIHDIAATVVTPIARTGPEVSAYNPFGTRAEPGPAPIPEERAAQKTDRAAADRVKIEAALGQISQHFSRSRTDLSFRIDDETDRMVVSVVDADDGRVLLQFPSEVALRIARNLGEAPVHLFEETA